MNTINQTFDVEVEEIKSNYPVPKVRDNAQVVTVTDPEQALIADLQSSREDFDEIIERGKEALQTVLEIAEEGQHPRFFEAASMMIKSLTDANRERMEIHLKLNQIRKIQRESGQEGPVNIEKALFVGTTSELLELVNPRHKKANT